MNNINEGRVANNLMKILQDNQFDNLIPMIKSGINSFPLFDQRIEFAQEILDEINIKLDPILLKSNPLAAEQIKVLEKVKDFLRDEIIFININLQTVYMALFVEEFIGKRLRNRPSENSMEKVS